MAIQTINIGRAANDGTGDDLREAFIKVNQNFQELDAVALQTAVNLGSSGARVFKEQVENIFNFRRIVAGTNITLTELDNTIVIDGTVPDQQTIITTDQGSITVGNGQPWELYGGDGVTISADNGASPNPTIVIDSALANDATPQLAASLDGNNQNITAVNNLQATSVLGGTLSVTGDAIVNNLRPTNINNINYTNNLGRFLTFDFGTISSVFEGQLQFVMGTTPVNLGTFTNPAAGNIDAGTIITS
tara:strand:+ start:2770 stop:3510 length:741 start_codon:yes stop_codon:yes gene_type:complete